MYAQRWCGNCGKMCMERSRGMACRSWTPDGTEEEGDPDRECTETRREDIEAARAAIEELNLLYKSN
jgi:hypothetical protein